MTDPKQAGGMDIPAKLRLAPSESPEELARRFDREKRAVELQREDRLADSLAPFRVGCVPYLNSVPLIRGIEEQTLLAPPSVLAGKLQNDELDAALLSVTEVLFSDRYDILDGIAIASLGEVKSVFLAHAVPLEQVSRIYCDTSSRTSVNLLKVLMGERKQPVEFVPVTPEEALANPPEALLLIGNPAIEFLRAPHSHEIWDLGAAWFELTRLPFVYAVWAMRRGVHDERLRRLLREARDFGMDTLDHIIRSRDEYDLDFRKDYLGWHIHYHLGSDEKRGLARFMDLLRRHSGQTVFEPRFVF